AVALVDGDDQLLADVAREVEVDIRDGRHVAVEEPPEREVGRDRVDVRQPGQVADERADRATATATRREDGARRVATTHLVRDLAGKLEHLPVQEEEPGQAELVDEGELLAQPFSRTRSNICARR